MSRPGDRRTRHRRSGRARRSRSCRDRHGGGRSRPGGRHRAGDRIRPGHVARFRSRPPDGRLARRRLPLRPSERAPADIGRCGDACGDVTRRVDASDTNARRSNSALAAPAARCGSPPLHCSAAPTGRSEIIDPPPPGHGLAVVAACSPRAATHAPTNRGARLVGHADRWVLEAFGEDDRALADRRVGCRCRRHRGDPRRRLPPDRRRASGDARRHSTTRQPNRSGHSRTTSSSA